MAFDFDADVAKPEADFSELSGDSVGGLLGQVEFDDFAAVVADGVLDAGLVVGVDGAGHVAVGRVDEVDEAEGVEGGEGAVDADDIDLFALSSDEFVDSVGRKGGGGLGEGFDDEPARLGDAQPLVFHSFEGGLDELSAVFGGHLSTIPTLPEGFMRVFLAIRLQ